MFSMGDGDDGGYFGIPDLIPNSGMLQEDSYDNDSEEEEEEEEGGVEKMDEEEEDALGTGADAIANLEVLQFPESKAAMHMESTHAGKFRLRAESIPIHFVSIPPHVMKAYSSHKEQMSKQKAYIASHSCMPGIVHTSPLISLFSSVAVVPPGQKPPAGGIPRAWHNQYTSFVYSVYQLKQLFSLIVAGGVIPFDPNTWNGEKMEHVINEFQHQIKVMEELQNERLEIIYETAVKPGTDPDAVMHEFISLLEKYSYQLIHLHEYLIWTIAVEPRCDMPLETILTPATEIPLLAQCTEQEQERIKEDCNMFFNHKVYMRREQERENRANGVENVDATPAVQLMTNSVMQETPLRYKQLIPLRTLYEYLFYLDTDGVLTKHNWRWGPK